MPALSPTMSQGNLTKWYVKEGDEVQPGTVLADVETDKAIMAFENQEEGFIAKLLIPAGSRDVPVGTPVAILVENAEDVAKIGDVGSSAAAAAAQPAAAPAAAPASSYPPHTVSARSAASRAEGNVSVVIMGSSSQRELPQCNEQLLQALGAWSWHVAWLHVLRLLSQTLLCQMARAARLRMMPVGAE